MVYHKMTHEKALNVFEKMKELWLALRKRDKTETDGYIQPDLFNGMEEPK